MNDSQWLQQDKLDLLTAQVGTDALPSLLEIFVQELRDYVDTLTQLSDLSAARDECGRICHAIKGSAPSFGAVLLSDKAQQLDALHKRQHWSEFDRQLADLVPALEGTIIQLEKYSQGVVK